MGSVIWKEDTLDGETEDDKLAPIAAHFPRIDEMDEVIENPTHNQDSNSRNWRSPIMFQLGDDPSKHVVDFLRIEEVGIPYSQDEGYGDKYLYLCLSDKLANFFRSSSENQYPLSLCEKNVRGEEGEWWRMVYNVEGLFGFVDGVFGAIVNEDILYQTASVKEILRKSRKGFRATVNLRFFCQASVDKTKKLDNNVARFLGVEVTRGYITSVDEDIKLPIRVSTAIPEPNKRDLISPSVRKRIYELAA